MIILNVSEARANFDKLVNEAADGHEIVTIVGKRGNAVLVSESDWNGVQATLHLLSIPGMRDSIREGMAERIEDCATALD
jgi:antitoxin YefM